MEPKVSIIVPVYNTEKYLHECLQSVISQTYSNLEIILIDDGSTDNSLEICNRFSSLDQRIKVFHQENAGVSVARNSGIEEASGDWLMFLDSDDCLQLDAVEILVSTLEEHNGELIFASGQIEEANKIIPLGKDDASVTEFNLTGDVLFSVACFLNFSCCTLNAPESIKKIGPLLTYPVMKLYKSELVKTIRFNRNVVWGEDQIFNYEYCCKINKMVFVDRNIYCYKMRSESVTNTANGRDQYYIDYAEHFIPLLCDDPVIRQAFSIRLCQNLYELCRVCVMNADGFLDAVSYISIVKRVLLHPLYNSALQQTKLEALQGKSRTFVVALLKCGKLKLAIFYLYMLFVFFPERNRIKAIKC